MKNLFTVLALPLFLLATGSVALAETLRSNEPVTVHLRPSSDAPVLGELQPGAQLRSPDERIVLGPDQERAGWRAIAYEGDIRGYVPRRALTKDLEVRPGSTIYHEPEASSDLEITEVNRNDVVNVGRLSGDWADVRVRKPVPGFIQYTPSRQGTAATEAPEEAQDFALEDEPRQQQRAQPIEDHGPVITTRQAIPTDGSMRLFQGYLSEPRSFLGRNVPYPYQVVTENGNRIAYLDLSRLLITTPLDTLIHYEFEFYGRAEKIEDRREFVIRVENMRLK